MGEFEELSPVFTPAMRAADPILAAEDTNGLFAARLRHRALAYHPGRVADPSGRLRNEKERCYARDLWLAGIGGAALLEASYLEVAWRTRRIIAGFPWLIGPVPVAAAIYLMPTTLLQMTMVAAASIAFVPLIARPLGDGFTMARVASIEVVIRYWKLPRSANREFQLTGDRVAAVMPACLCVALLLLPTFLMVAVGLESGNSMLPPEEVYIRDHWAMLSTFWLLGAGVLLRVLTPLLRKRVTRRWAKVIAEADGAFAVFFRGVLMGDSGG